MAHDSDPATVLVAAYQHAAEGGPHRQLPPGPNSRAAQPLHARARIIDRDTFMASHPTRFDPTRRISDGGILLTASTAIGLRHD